MNAERNTPLAGFCGMAAQAPATALTAGERIGRYLIERELGSGGFGQVLLARDEELDRHVAVKIPRPDRDFSPEEVTIYLTEARTLASLDHPHIVPVYDVGRISNGHPYIVSKYVEGSDLAQRMTRAPVTVAEAARWTATVAEALHYAHKRGLVHRDIKPGNILLDVDGNPHVVDFGLALKETDLGKGPRLAGTIAYMSPEQARGEAHRVDGRSDIYSLGAVLYQLLTGRRTFTADNRAELLKLIARKEPKPPRQINDQIPKELERICLKALSRRASDRYTTAKDMAEDLWHFLGNAEVSSALAVSERTPPAVAMIAEPGPAADSSTPRVGSATADSERQPIRIVPKGLRSFDEHDADFFLELLPGPRDREGLPDSIRFWKTRIEEIDADQTFAVGLIYGPSGCGKSSLMKAALKPRLSPDVISVYVESTGQETELRLLKGLRKRCPGLPQSLDLTQTLVALRRGHGIAAGKKVLIVLDQFEQWLHAQAEVEHGELVQALRQCDGGQVQCIVMVRDDFWLAVSRFMRELEIRLIEGENSALVDLFDTDHARRVLAAFGRAYGRIPEDPNDLTAAQQRFLDQAIHGLAQDGKVICVRLSLFAELMKGKSWAPGVLAQAGGTEGVGVAFLQETFSESTSPPEHRRHAAAACRVLHALLPESGTNIRGHMRTHADLLEASGYDRHPQDFADLLHILDRELRLITPTDPEGKAADEDSSASAVPGQKHYQLTHDYLVPSLRQWLTRKQREELRGRAELRLAERAALWNAKPENRHLPSSFEYLSIRCLTPKKTWTKPQSRMMQRASRVLGLRWAAILLLLSFAGFGVQQVLSHQREYLAAEKLKNDRTRAESLAETVLTAPADAVPYAMENLRELREHAIPNLRSCFSDENADQRYRLHAAFALASFGEVEYEFLIDSIATAAVGQYANILSALERAVDSIEAALKRAASAAETQEDWRSKARLAIMGLELGLPALAQEMLQFRPDPIQRTIFIDTFKSWHGDIVRLAPIAAKIEDDAFRSGMCQAVGGLRGEALTPSVKRAWQQLLSDWYEKDSHPGTHSAAGWALRQWELPLPVIAPSREPVKGRQWYVNSLGMTMLRIPEGSFFRIAEDLSAISTTGYRGVPSDTEPQEVHLTHPFYMSDRETSVGLFQQFMDDATYTHEKPKDRPPRNKRVSPTPDHPEHQVSWFDAVMFCNWLSRRERLTPCYRQIDVTTWELVQGVDGYRLPTEAEWEYACRAGTTTAYPHGDDGSYSRRGADSLISEYAVFLTAQTQAGGSKRPNAWGLYDICGNMAEWCQDWYGDYPEALSLNDPSGPAQGSHRVRRGGGWNGHGRYMRSSMRFHREPGFRAAVGFRVARSISGE